MITKADRARIARIALTQDGVREEGGNNCGPKVREYQNATWLAPDAWPWCAAFVDWVVMIWLQQISAAEPLFMGESLLTWRPKTAGAFDLVNWARGHNLLILSKTAETEAGDVVVFDMSHCGIVTADHVRTTPLLRTVEGNTGPAGKRDAESGDGVFQKKRDRSMVRSFIRMELA